MRQDQSVTRRGWLSLCAVGATVLAGCGGSGSNGGTTTGGGGGGSGSGGGNTTATTTGSSGSGQESTPTTSSETQTTTASGGSQSDLSVASSSFEMVDSGLGPEPVMIGEVENTGDGAFSYVEATAKFFNDDGNVLDTSLDNMRGLSGGETWALYIPFPGMGEDASDGEITITDAAPGSIPPPPEGAELVNDELRPPADEFSSPQVAGTAENTGDATIPYLEAFVKYFDTAGNVLGSASTNVTELSPGQTWEFQVDLLTLNPDAEIDDYEVQLADVL